MEINWKNKRRSTLQREQNIYKGLEITRWMLDSCHRAQRREGTCTGEAREGGRDLTSLWSEVKVTQSCLALCNPMNYTVHGILQARILEWVSCSLLQGIFPTQGSNPGLPHCRRILYQLSHIESPRILEWVAYPISRGSSRPRNQTGSPALQADSSPTELSGHHLHPVKSES